MMRLSAPPNEEQTLLASVEEFLRPMRAANCSCGSVYSSNDAVFWGECEKCRNPARHRSRVAGRFTSAGKADRNYHGGGWPEDCHRISLIQAAALSRQTLRPEQNATEDTQQHCRRIHDTASEH